MQTPYFLNHTTFAKLDEIKVIYLKNPAVKPKAYFWEFDSFCCLSLSFLLTLVPECMLFGVFNSAVIEMIHILISSCTDFQRMS